MIVLRLDDLIEACAHVETWGDAYDRCYVAALLATAHSDAPIDTVRALFDHLLRPARRDNRLEIQ